MKSFGKFKPSNFHKQIKVPPNRDAKLVGGWEDLAVYYFDGENYWSMDPLSGRLTNIGESMKNKRGVDLNGSPISES